MAMSWMSKILCSGPWACGDLGSLLVPFPWCLSRPERLDKATHASPSVELIGFSDIYADGVNDL
jgi:hypothetical protein